MVVDAIFEGMAAGDPAVRFLFDWDVFASKNRHPVELFRAVFRKLGELLPSPQLRARLRVSCGKEQRGSIKCFVFPNWNSK